MSISDYVISWGIFTVHSELLASVFADLGIETYTSLSLL